MEDKAMKGKFLVLHLALLFVLAASPVAASTTAQKGTDGPTTLFYSDFEKTLQPWKEAGDGVQPNTLTRHEGKNGCKDGGKSFGLLRSGEPGPTLDNNMEIPLPIATWAQAQYPVPGSGTWEVSVEWSASANRDCADCMPAAYIGTTPPERGSKLRSAGAPLKNYWQRYNRTTAIRLDSLTDRKFVYVAVGWMGSDASINLDCLTVSFRTQSAR
jgi:hypothetical protein